MLINGHELYVEVHGEIHNPPVILLHHGLGAVPAWQAQVDSLVQAGYRVIVYDRWGFGRSAPRTGYAAPAFEQDRRDLQALIAALGLGRVALVGHSDGGTLALYAALDAPQRVTCLVTIAAHIYIEPKMDAGIQPVRAAFERKGSLYRGLTRLHGAKAESVFYNWFGGWRRPENLTWDLRPQLGSIRCPAYVVQGREDEYATPQHAFDLAVGLPAAGLWLVPGANHMLPQEMPEQFMVLLSSFLSVNWPQTQSAGS